MNKYEFYNIEEDPDEEKNLAGIGLEEEEEMKKLLQSHMQWKSLYLSKQL